MKTRSHYSKRKVYDGVEYRSGLETTIAEQLTIAGVPFEFESTSFNYWLKKPRATCYSCGEQGDIWEEHWYTPDFLLLDSGIIIETKGRFLSKDRTKMKAVLRDHPEEDIRMLFSRDSKLIKGRDVRCSDWCIENDVKYAIGKVPSAWI